MKKLENRIYRVIDANLNRLREALRIIEDISRFILDNKKITRQIKDLRHRLLGIVKINSLLDKLISIRNVEKDIGRKSNFGELTRKNAKDILFANIQRAKESIRVLEEFFKLLNKDSANKLKNIRYKIYQIEKELLI